MEGQTPLYLYSLFLACFQPWSFGVEVETWSLSQYIACTDNQLQNEIPISTLHSWFLSVILSEIFWLQETKLVFMAFQFFSSLCVSSSVYFFIHSEEAVRNLSGMVVRRNKSASPPHINLHSRFLAVGKHFTHFRKSHMYVLSFTWVLILNCCVS